MLLLFEGKGRVFVKEFIRDGPAEIDGTMHIGDEVKCLRAHLCT